MNSYIVCSNFDMWTKQGNRNLGVGQITGDSSRQQFTRDDTCLGGMLPVYSCDQHAVNSWPGRSPRWLLSSMLVGHVQYCSRWKQVGLKELLSRWKEVEKKNRILSSECVVQ